MGIFFSTVWKSIFSSSKKYKICMLGLDNAGKTTILFKLHLGDVVETQPTIGSNVEEIKVKNLRFVCWDLGGQTALRKNWGDYFTNTSAVLMVIDSSDRKRIDEVKKEFYRVLADPNLKNACFLVLANKQDCSNKMEAAEIAQKLNLMALKSHSWHIQATCALTGKGLTEVVKLEKNMSIFDATVGMDWVSHQITKSKS